mmetsp:Transcript_29962/g.54343  ORF Transcript_29962/g.54343 Transcript_29962/m.54343 type:complete len:365 (+) Transcript_29962:84-1178(+)
MSPKCNTADVLTRTQWKTQLTVMFLFPSVFFFSFHFFTTNVPDDTNNIKINATHRPCQYEKAIGHFNQTFSQQKNPEANWEWISDQPDCLIVDFVHSLKKFHLFEPVTILFIGDSLDHRSVQELCNVWPLDEAKRAKYNDELANKASSSHKASVLCTNGVLTVAHFIIHGMKRTCSNGGCSGKIDSRVYNTTAQRIEKLLAHDILADDFLEGIFKGPVVAMIGSCLWDLSQGCNYSPSIDPLFLDDYTRGIKNNYKAVKAAGVHHVFWRTCPPLSKVYSDKNNRIGAGRTRSNQEILNHRLLEVVAKENIGIVVDWWKMISDHVPEENIDMWDGKHYNKGPTLAFVNMFLNTVFYHHEELMRGS